MAINLGTAYVDIVPSTSGLAPALRREVDGPLARAGEQGGRSFSSRFVGAVSGAGSRAVSAIGTAVTVGVGAAGLGAGGLFGASFATGFSRFTSLENAEKMLTQLGLETGQVESLMGSLNETLTGTAFAMDEGAGALARMVSSGLGLDRVPGVMDSIADAAAFGQAPMSEIGDIFGRIQSQGRATAMELNRLTARNIPAFELLASAMGTGVEELQEMVSTGTLDAATFFHAWEEGAKGFGENNIIMAGAAKSMGDTTQGALANMRAAIARFGVTAFAPIFEQIGPLANRIRDGLNRLAPIVASAVERVSTVVSGLVEVFQVDGLSGVLSRVGELFSGAVSDWGARLVDAWPQIRTRLSELVSAVGAWVVVTVPVISRQLVAWGTAFVEWIGPLIPPALRELGRMVGALGSWILDRGLPLLVEHLARWGAAFVAWVVPMIPPMLVELAKLLADLGVWITTDALPKIVGKVAEWGVAFAGWVAQAGRDLLSNLASWWVDDAAPWFGELPGKIAAKILEFISVVYEAGVKLANALWRGFQETLARSPLGMIAGAVDTEDLLGERVTADDIQNMTPRQRDELGLSPRDLERYGVIPPSTPAPAPAPSRPNLNVEVDARGVQDPAGMADHLRRLLAWEMVTAGVTG